MNEEPQPQPADVILRAVLGMLESGGYDAVQLRAVAQHARVSLATIYKLFPTRDELVVAAVEQWMAANIYSRLALPPAGESLYDGLMRVFRCVFEPWERSPRMLEAYHRARTSPGGGRLELQARNAVEPVARAVLLGGDPAYVRDIELVLTNVAYALMGRCADGEFGATEILPMLERTVFRLTADNEADARAARRPTDGRRPARVSHSGRS